MAHGSDSGGYRVPTRCSADPNRDGEDGKPPSSLPAVLFGVCMKDKDSVYCLFRHKSESNYNNETKRASLLRERDVRYCRSTRQSEKKNRPPKGTTNGHIKCKGSAV